MLCGKTNIYTITALFLVITIDAMGVGLVWPIFGPLLAGQHNSILSASVPIFIHDLIYGIAMGVFPFFMFFGAPILGDLSDHIGRKKVLLISLFGSAAGLGICALGVACRDVYLVILGRALLGLLAGSQATAQATIVDITKPEKKAVSLSVITLASSFGFTIGPMLGSLLIDKHLVSWFTLTTPFLVSAVLAVVNGFFLALVFKETFYPKNPQRICLTKGIKIFTTAMSNKNIRMILLAYLLMMLGWSTSYQYCVINFTQKYNYTSAELGHFFSAISLVGVFSALIMVRFTLKYFNLKHMVYGALILMFCSFAISLYNKETLIWVTMMISILGVSLSGTGLTTMTSNAASVDEQGYTMGVMGSMNALAWGGGALFGSGFSSLSSTLPIPFVISVVALGLGFSCAWFSQRQ